MEFKLTFSMDSESFDKRPEYKIFSILKWIGDCVIEGETFGDITDSEGRYIGIWEIIP